MLETRLLDFGGKPVFCGRISTVQVHEDNVLVRRALEEQGHGRVLVIDGAASLRCALVGDQLAALALSNGWAAVIVNGAIRDSVAIGRISLGVKALGTNPKKSAKAGKGSRDVPVTFGGVTFTPGEYLYADEDGVIVSVGKIG